MLKVHSILLAVLLAGCGKVILFGHTVREEPAASVVKSDSTNASTDVATPAVHRVKAVVLSLTPPAAEKVANDSKFNTDALLDAIKGELKSRGLLDDAGLNAAGSPASDTMTISIDDYALRPTTNVILFGKRLNAGVLSGNVVLSDPRGAELQRYRIDAEAKVSIPEDGEAKNFLQPLYREFSIEMADKLIGKSTSNAEPSQR